MAGRYTSKWISYVENELNSLGFSNIWQEQYVDMNWFKPAVKTRTEDQARQNWLASVHNNVHCKNYRLFKTSFGFESYLDKLQCKKAKVFCPFRTRNYGLPVDPHFNVPALDATCKLCNQNSLGDEFHYIMECTELAEARNNCMGRVKFKNTEAFSNNINNCKIGKIRKLCTFIEIIKSKIDQLND